MQRSLSEIHKLLSLTHQGERSHSVVLDLQNLSHFLMLSSGIQDQLRGFMERGGNIFKSLQLVMSTWQKLFVNMLIIWLNLLVLTAESYNLDP